MTDSQIEAARLLWSLGKPVAFIAAQLAVPLADVASLLAADPRPVQRHLFDSQPGRDGVCLNADLVRASFNEKCPVRRAT